MRGQCLDCGTKISPNDRRCFRCAIAHGLKTGPVTKKSVDHRSPPKDAEGLCFEVGVVYRNTDFPSIWRCEQVGHREVSFRLLWFMDGYRLSMGSEDVTAVDHSDPSLYHVVVTHVNRWSRVDPAWVGRVYQDYLDFIRKTYGGLAER